MKSVSYKVGQKVTNKRKLSRTVTKVTPSTIYFSVKRGKVSFNGKNSKKTFRRWHIRKD